MEEKESPQNYAQWCAFLDELLIGPKDDRYLNRIESGYISWSSGVADRFFRVVTNMLTSRINKSQDVYKRQLAHSHGNISNAILALKDLQAEYIYCYRIAAALPIPSDYKRQLKKLVQDHADQAQKSLEDSAKSDRTGHLLQIVRNAKVNKLQ